MSHRRQYTDPVTDSRAGAPFDPRLGWLPLAVPAEPLPFSVTDARLAAALCTTGSEVVDGVPGITAAGVFSGSAWAAVPIDAGAVTADSFPARAAVRLTRAALVGARARRISRLLRGSGFEHVTTIRWDVGGPLGNSDEAPIRSRLTLGALVVGKDVPARSALDQARVDAATATGTSFTDASFALREGAIVGLGADAVLRVSAVGAGAHALRLQARALSALDHPALPSSIRSRLPLPLAAGATASCEWTVERRLVGTAPKRLDDRILGECVDFLSELHSCGAGGSSSVTDDAQTVARYVPEHARAMLSRVAERARDAVADLPRGFGHGDFSLSNILVADGSLTGVVDWDRAGPSRLPFLDLLQLQLSRKHGHFGRRLRQELEPWFESGDEATDRLAARLGVSLTREQRLALGTAFWLDRVAFELRTYADRPQRQDWLDANVTHALRELAPLV